MRLIDIVLARIIALASWLVLPVSLLLFVQWPLRDLVRAHSREANDLGQVLFALYVALAVTAATRRGAHLAMDLAARHYSDRIQRLLRQGAVIVGLLPWSLFLLVTGAPLFRDSIMQAERFSDTGNPGYVVVKLAAGLLALAMVAQGLVELRRPLQRARP